jgi:hypothetical protein
MSTVYHNLGWGSLIKDQELSRATSCWKDDLQDFGKGHNSDLTQEPKYDLDGPRRFQGIQGAGYSPMVNVLLIFGLCLVEWCVLRMVKDHSRVPNYARARIEYAIHTRKVATFHVMH